MMRCCQIMQNEEAYGHKRKRSGPLARHNHHRLDSSSCRLSHPDSMHFSPFYAKNSARRICHRRCVDASIKGCKDANGFDGGAIYGTRYLCAQSKARCGRKETSQQRWMIRNARSGLLSFVISVIGVLSLIQLDQVDAFHLPSMRCNRNSLTGSYIVPVAFRLRYEQSAMYSTTDESHNTVTTSPTPINPASTPQTTNEYSFFDEATVYIRAGSGGQGASTYRKGIKNQNGPPDGGNGGKGGDVIFQMDESLNTLAGLARYAWRPNSFGGGGGAKRRGNDGEAMGRILTFRAENGGDGERRRRQGRNGKEAIVRVPPGTVILEELLMMPNDNHTAIREDDYDESKENDSEPIYKKLGTISRANPIMTIAKGGQGGEGSGINSQRGVRRPRNSPEGGERKRLKLTLKVVADVALVAVPNAGKSTLLSKVTRAKPKIADYPFTTVVPNLGVWVPSKDFEIPEEDEQYDDDGNLAPPTSKSLILCDVPGLIAGASDGIGLGHAFLRHVERCHVILHLLDATSENVLEEYAMINKELMRYGTGKLALMPQVVVVNKVDIAFGEDGDYDEAKKRELEMNLKEVMPHSRLMWISAKEGEGVDDLMERVSMFVKKVKDVTTG